MDFTFLIKTILADAAEAGATVSVFNMVPQEYGGSRVNLATYGPVVMAGPERFQVRVSDTSVLQFGTEDIVEVDLCTVGYVHVILALGEKIVDRIITPVEVPNA